MKKFSKLMAALLALVLCLSLLPMAVFAEEVDTEPELEETIETLSAAKAAGEDCGIGKHNWKYVTTKEPTCTEWGEKVSRCTKCGKDQPGIMPMPVAPNGHDWEFVSCAKKVYTSLCSTSHIDLMRCKTCGEQEERLNSAGHSHNWVITSDAVDLGEIGDYDTDTRHTVKCTNCTAVETRDHSFNSATCTAPETCACGKVKLNSKPLGHDMTHHEAVAATCTTAGNIEYWSCSRCNKNFSNANGTTEVTNVTISAGHKLTNVPAVTATCLQPGNIEYWSCSQCGKNFSDANGTTEAANVTTAVDGANHDAACTVFSRGYDENQHWNVRTCGATERHEDHEYVGNECNVCGYKRNTPHTHVYGEWIITVDPTEETEGSAERRCGCGDTQTMVLPALGSGEWNYAVTTRATCIATGVGTYTYTSGETSFSKTVTLPVDPTNHVGETEVRDAVAATATTAGYTGDTYCLSCNGLISTGEEIPATGTGGEEIEPPDVPLVDGTEIDEPEVPLAGLMTRAEFVNYLYVQAGSPEAQASTFTDVSEDHEYAAAIGWAQANGIAKGVTEDEFAPDEIVSVEQATLFLVRYAQFSGVEMPELAALAGKDPLEILDNADEVLAEFFEAILPKPQAA